MAKNKKENYLSFTILKFLPTLFLKLSVGEAKPLTKFDSVDYIRLILAVIILLIILMVLAFIAWYIIVFILVILLFISYKYYIKN